MVFPAVSILISLQLVSGGSAWFYQTASSQPAASIVKQQYLLPPYPNYQHELLHQTPPGPLHLHDNRYYSPGQFAEPTSYNDLSFEGPYEVTAPRVPGLYFRLSSGVFVPVKAVYSFPPFLERLVQRIQGYYSVYNPPETLSLERPLPTGGIAPSGIAPGGVAPGGVPLGGIPPTGVLPPTLELLPVLPPHHPEHPHPEIPLGEKPDSAPEPVPEEGPEPEDAPVTQSSDDATTTTTESTKEETTVPGEASSSTDVLDSSTESPVEETTSA